MFLFQISAETRRELESISCNKRNFPQGFPYALALQFVVQSRTWVLHRFRCSCMREMTYHFDALTLHDKEVMSYQPQFSFSLFFQKFFFTFGVPALSTISFTISVMIRCQQYILDLDKVLTPIPLLFNTSPG